MIAAIKLPYSYKALEPYYDEETLKIHYDKLYMGYVSNLNKVQEKLKIAREEKNFENIKCLERDLSFHGSGVILHELFFTNMAPKSEKSVPNKQLLDQINHDFESFENFKAQFNAASKNVEASRMVFISMAS